METTTDAMRWLRQRIAWEHWLADLHLESPGPERADAGLGDDWRGRRSA